MNISIEIKSPELAQAILALAKAMGNTSVMDSPTPDPVSAPEAPAAPVQPTQQHSQPVPTSAPIQQQQPQQMQAAPPQPQAVPTASTSYSMEQIAVAATQLVDAGRRDELVQLLGSFGVPALTALPKEQYGAFATKLREMGAKI